MIPARSRSLSLALLATLAAVVASPARPGAETRGSAGSGTRPSGGLYGSWRELKASVSASRDARWNGSLSAILKSAGRRDRADSAFRRTLDPLPDARSVAVIPPEERLSMASGSLARGAPKTALRLLEPPGLSDPASLTLRALARSRVEGARAGLSTLGWPPDAPGGARQRGHDDAQLFLAAALADSIDDERARRAALWRLHEERRPPPVRAFARRSLARSLAASGELRLARSLLERVETPSTEEALLLGDLSVASADTLGAMRSLAAQAARSGLPASERYACARKAAALLKLGAAAAAPERDWTGILRALGDLGEAPLALELWPARPAAPDSAAALARSELHAALLLRVRRFDAAALEYRALAARSKADSTSRAGYVLGLARAQRGARQFAGMDSAFQRAAALDPRGAAGEAAAWERAREWEDARAPLEAADRFAWAMPWLRSASLRSAARVHAALALDRAGASDSARAALAAAEASDQTSLFWRALFARAAGDTAAAAAAFRAAYEKDPGSYEGSRSAEELGIAPAPPPAPRARRATDPPVSVEILGLVGFGSLERDRLRTCALGGPGTEANGCIDALEALSVYRVGRVEPERDARLRFPPAFPEPVLGAARAESLSASLLWAIMRLESAYDPTARSRAGALGLLQLLPSTASRLAGRTIVEDSLSDPSLNVTLGARYVRSLVREFGDAKAAIAAFNAGEEAVRRWIAARPLVDDRWVELIPYRETRDYVKQVYAAWRRYESIYGRAGED